MSEPHFLHGDQKLLGYAQGLTPNEELHSTFIIIEPITGIMLSWQSRLQLNMKLIKIDTHLLSNISEGYIPIIWFDRVRLNSLSSILVSYIS
uniref:Sensory neuron membrane protein 2 n=1 Tax=Sclerodermus sp. MQW-2015 TaxID=1729718 RepID=A0A0N9JZG7_9HYME|nr:sensory neuron membrane protein 2 [Sclerodermus sp. MQW-2015]